MIRNFPSYPMKIAFPRWPGLFSALFLVWVSFGISLEAEDEKSLWKEILSAKSAEIPSDPGGEIQWRSDLAGAFAEARDKNIPLLVTWRCLPCEQCAEFDKDVLDGSSELSPLLRRFITVRMTNATALDETYFPYRTHQDLDLSWWAYFLSPEGELYGVFGGKDHVSDSTRISEKAFVNSLDRVLNHHYHPRRKAWKIDLTPRTDGTAATSPQETKGYQLLLEDRPNLEKPHPQFGSCLHCHQVGDTLNLEAMDEGTFSAQTLKEKWPLPENLGILLDRDDGLLIRSITPGSPAETAGLKAGDCLGMANRTRLFGQADFRGVLHRAKDTDAILVGLTRDGEESFASLQPTPGWKTTENWWRKTVYDGVYGPGMGFFPLKGPQAGKGKGLSIKPWMGRPPTGRPIYQTGLRPNMEIIAINEMSEDMEIRKLIAWFRLNHQPGDEVTYTVRGGQKFRYTLPEK